jgi:hypothetical protein
MGFHVPVTEYSPLAASTTTRSNGNVNSPRLPNHYGKTSHVLNEASNGVPDAVTPEDASKDPVAAVRTCADAATLAAASAALIASVNSGPS